MCEGLERSLTHASVQADARNNIRALSLSPSTRETVVEIRSSIFRFSPRDGMDFAPADNSPCETLIDTRNRDSIVFSAARVAENRGHAEI